MDLFNHESEIAILSILLKHPEKLYEIGTLKTEYFSSAQHQIIFNTITQLLSEALVPDENLVVQRLSKNNQLDLIGIEFIRNLINKEFSPENLREYCKNITESYIAKHALNFTPKIQQLLAEGKDIFEVLNRVSFDISDLVNQSSSNATKTSAELTDTYRKAFDERISNPNGRFITSGFKDLDTFIGGISVGDLWVIAGRTSMGKTSLLLSSIISSASKGIPILLFSKEMNWESVMDRALALLSNVSLYKIRLGMVLKDSEDYVRIMNALDIIKGLPIYIDTNFSSDINYVCAVIRKYHHKYGIKLAYVDYAQLLAERDSEAVHELGRITKSLKLLATELNIGIHLASQLNRQVEFREDKRPILSDLRQSGNIEEDADLVAFLYRDEYYNQESEHRGKIEYIIRKNRNGPIGTVMLKFDEKTTRIE